MQTDTTLLVHFLTHLCYGDCVRSQRGDLYGVALAGENAAGTAEAWRVGYEAGIAEKNVVSGHLTRAIEALKAIQQVNIDEHGQIADLRIDALCNEALKDT